MRKLAMIGIAFLLFVSIAYAGVLEYYGKIVGNVNVQPPTFYADSSPLQTGGVYYKMKINEVGSGTVSLQDGNRVLFVTDSLGITSWYPAKWIVKIKVYSPSTDGGLSTIRIKKVRQNLLAEDTICEWEAIPLTQGNNSIQENCTTGQISFTSTDRFGLEIVGGGGLTYTIYTDGLTRVEVTKT
jgi:hypothetical protein